MVLQDLSFRIYVVKDLKFWIVRPIL